MGKQVAARLKMGLQLSRLERTPDKREVGGSSPLKPRVFENMEDTIWGYSSVGRAPALQAGGHEFESRYLHLIIVNTVTVKWMIIRCTLKIAYKKRNDKRNIKTSEVIVKSNN